MWLSAHLLVRRCLRESLLFLQGIMHETRSIFTAQFYPDANPGPRDTEVMYEGWSVLMALGVQVFISRCTSW